MKSEIWDNGELVRFLSTHHYPDWISILNLKYFANANFYLSLVCYWMLLELITSKRDRNSSLLNGLLLTAWSQLKIMAVFCKHYQRYTITTINKSSYLFSSIYQHLESWLISLMLFIQWLISGYLLRLVTPWTPIHFIDLLSLFISLISSHLLHLHLSSYFLIRHHITFTSYDAILPLQPF